MWESWHMSSLQEKGTEKQKKKTKKKKNKIKIKEERLCYARYPVEQNDLLKI